VHLLELGRSPVGRLRDSSDLVLPAVTVLCSNELLLLGTSLPWVIASAARHDGLLGCYARFFGAFLSCMQIQAWREEAERARQTQRDAEKRVAEAKVSAFPCAPKAFFLLSFSSAQALVEPVNHLQPAL